MKLRQMTSAAERKKYTCGPLGSMPNCNLRCPVTPTHSDTPLGDVRPWEFLSQVSQTLVRDRGRVRQDQTCEVIQPFKVDQAGGGHARALQVQGAEFLERGD